MGEGGIQIQPQRRATLVVAVRDWHDQSSPGEMEVQCNIV